MTVCVCVCVCVRVCARARHNSLNHTTKRVNFSTPKIHRNVTTRETTVCCVSRGSAHTPGVSDLCTLATHLGPGRLWISGAVCKVPST